MATQVCELRWRSSGHNTHSLCIVCEMGARIRDRDYKAQLKLLEGDISSLLNHHIFLFPRYFDGDGPAKGVRYRPRAPIVAGEKFTSGEFAVEKQKRQRAGGMATGLTAHEILGKTAMFDEILSLTAKPHVHVKESSEISNIVQKFARKWDSLSTESIILPDLDEVSHLPPRVNTDVDRSQSSILVCKQKLGHERHEEQC